MVVLSNVILILVSLAGLTTAGLLEGLMKSGGAANNSALGGAFGKALGTGLLSGLISGIKRAKAGEKVDPGLANVLSSFTHEFDGQTRANSGGTEAVAGSSSTTAGSSGRPREDNSSEENNKDGAMNVVGTTDSASGRPSTTTPGGSAPGTPSQKPQGQPGTDISAKTPPAKHDSGTHVAQTPGLPCSAANPGAAVATNVGAVAGVALASKIFSLMSEAIKKNREKRINQRLGGHEKPRSRREKRSLVEDMGLKEAKGAFNGLNNVPGY